MIGSLRTIGVTHFTTMEAGGVTGTLELALETSGCSVATVISKPRPLSDEGASYFLADLE